MLGECGNTTAMSSLVVCASRLPCLPLPPGVPLLRIPGDAEAGEADGVGLEQVAGLELEVGEGQGSHRAPRMRSGRKQLEGLLGLQAGLGSHWVRKDDRVTARGRMERRESAHESLN